MHANSVVYVDVLLFEFMSIQQIHTHTNHNLGNGERNDTQICKFEEKNLVKF